MNIRNIRVPRRDDYEKRPVLSATIHPDIKTNSNGDFRADWHERQSGVR